MERWCQHFLKLIENWEQSRQMEETEEGEDTKKYQEEEAEDETNKALGKLTNGKRPGNDELTSGMMKNLNEGTKERTKESIKRQPHKEGGKLGLAQEDISKYEKKNLHSWAPRGRCWRGYWKNLER